MTTWRGAAPAGSPPIPLSGRILAALRIGPLAIWVFGMLLVHGIVRAVERPICGTGRPVSPWITVTVCRGALRILGIRLDVSGPVMRGQGALVANHGSWLDIFVLNATGPLYFVSKSEVSAWPGIGWLARATGTVFINRAPREAGAHRGLLERRLAAGHRLLFFPEGTSTDTLRVLPFKTTLFGAFFGGELGPEMEVQPVSVVYHPPEGAPDDFFGWWGDMAFAADLAKHLAAWPGGSVEVVRHPPLRVADHTDRKALARAAEAAVRGGLGARRTDAIGRQA